MPSLEPALSHKMPGFTVAVPTSAEIKSGAPQKTGSPSFIPNSSAPKNEEAFLESPASLCEGSAKDGSLFISSFENPLSKRNCLFQYADSNLFSGRIVQGSPVRSHKKYSGPLKTSSLFFHTSWNLSLNASKRGIKSELDFN